MALTCRMTCNSTKTLKSNRRKTNSSCFCSSKLRNKVNSLRFSSNCSFNSRNTSRSQHKTIWCKWKTFISSWCKILKPKLCGTIFRLTTSKMLINQLIKILFLLIWEAFNNSSFNKNFNFSRLNNKICWLKPQSPLFKVLTFKQTQANQSLKPIHWWTRLNKLIKIRL